MIPQRRPFPSGRIHAERNGWLPFHLSRSHFCRNHTFIHEQHPRVPLWRYGMPVASCLRESRWQFLDFRLAESTIWSNQPWWGVGGVGVSGYVQTILLQTFSRMFLFQDESTTRTFSALGGNNKVDAELFLFVTSSSFCQGKITKPGMRGMIVWRCSKYPTSPGSLSGHRHIPPSLDNILSLFPKVRASC